MNTEKTVDAMIDDIVRREGGYVNHPADRGGPTKYGITQETLSEYCGRPMSETAVAAMSTDKAKEIYEARYYRNPGIDKLPPSIQPFVFDTAVNHGPKRAIEMVQVACKFHGLDPGPIDGIVGPRTIAAARLYAREFLDYMIAWREGFYKGIVERDPSQQVFLAGWMNRLKEFA